MRNSIYISLFLSFLFSFSLAYAEVVFSENFDAEPTGEYSKEQLAAAWNKPTWSSGPGEGRVFIVEGDLAYGDGKSLRVDYPANTYGPDASGAQWKLNLGGTYDTLYASYKIMIPQGFDSVKGGKIPGLCGGQCNTGGNEPTGLDGFSTRMMWRNSSSGADNLHTYLVSYLYYMDQVSRYGDDYYWATGLTPGWTFAESEGHVWLEPGQWHTVTTKIGINTPGEADGSLEAWFDGIKVLEQNNIRYRAAGADFAIDVFYFSTFFGGGDASWATSKAESIYYDEFIISTVPTPDIAETPVSINTLRNSHQDLRMVGEYVHYTGKETILLEIFGVDGRLLAKHRLEPSQSVKLSHHAYNYRVANP